MENTVNRRISTIIEVLGYRSRSAFSKKIGIAQTSLNAIINGAEPKHSTLFKILEAEPSISAEWLVTGNGPMLKDRKPAASSDMELITRLRIENDLLRQLVGLRTSPVNGDAVP